MSVPAKVPANVPDDVPADLPKAAAPAAKRKRARNDDGLPHLTRDGDGWRFQKRLPVGLFADFIGQGPAPAIRVGLGPRSRGEARRLGRQLAALCEAVAAAAAVAMRKEQAMPEDQANVAPNELIRQVVDACQNAIKKAVARPANAIGLAHALAGSLASLQLVQSEVAKGEAGARAVVDNAETLTRGALADVLKHASDPTRAREILATTSDIVRSPTPTTSLTLPTSPPGAPAPQPAPAAGQAPLFSQIEDEYLAMREGAGADRATLSTTRVRAGLFRELMGDKPFDTYRPKDMQDYVNLLQYLPVAYTRQGEEHEALQHMSPRWLIARNKQFRCWEPIARKTLKDGYAWVVKTIVSNALSAHRFYNPFAGMRIRWPDNAKPSVKREALDYEKLDKLFDLGLRSGYLDDAMIAPLAFLSTRRIGIVPWIRGCDIDQKHGVDVVRVNGIVFDKARGQYVRVPYKTGASLRFFVLHRFFRAIGFTEWAMAQGEEFIFRLLQQCADPSDAASKRINRLLRAAGAIGMNIEVGHSLRHGGKELLIDEDIDGEATRLQMGHDAGDVHTDYGSKSELRRKQCQELYTFALPKQINWGRFRGLDFAAMAATPRRVGRPKKGS